MPLVRNVNHTYKKYAFTNEEHWLMVYDQLKWKSDKINRVDIATYNINYNEFVEKALYFIRQYAPEVRMLIGHSGNREMKSRLGLQNWVNSISGVKAYIKEACHMKCFIFDRGPKHSTAIIGGRNLTSGDWIDFSCVMDGALAVKKLTKHFTDAVRKGERLEDLFYSQKDIDSLSERIARQTRKKKEAKQAVKDDIENLSRRTRKRGK